VRKVSLEEVLAFREKRASRRQELLAEYSLPLACLGLNIPGEYKAFPWARRSFHEEMETFALALEAEGLAVSHAESEEESAGYTAYISIAADPEALKALALRIEENHPLGRLFDIDIYESGGKKLSREDTAGIPGSSPRPCFICGENGFACARSRAHTPEELYASVLRIMENWLRQTLGDRVSSAAVWAMMSEAAITPKPGLVDRANSGAHRDMDFFTFIDSASAILTWFHSCALAGFDSEGEDPQALFESLRPPGRVAEVLMKRATGGVNTHKGYIFSLGILSAAYGRLFRNTELPGLAGVLEFTKDMTAKLGEDFSRSQAKEASHGEAVYAQTGIQGIRGEVSRGFPVVSEHALPLFRRMLKEGYSLNDAGIAVILKLMAHTEDTNIIHRGGAEALGTIQEDLRSFFASGPADMDMETIREKAAALDREFIFRNISPGGCADLLGTTFFLYRLFEGRQ